ERAYGLQSAEVRRAAAILRGRSAVVGEDGPGDGDGMSEARETWRAVAASVKGGRTNPRDPETSAEKERRAVYADRREAARNGGVPDQPGAREYAADGGRRNGGRAARAPESRARDCARGAGAAVSANRSAGHGFGIRGQVPARGERGR